MDAVLSLNPIMLKNNDISTGNPDVLSNFYSKEKPKLDTIIKHFKTSTQIVPLPLPLIKIPDPRNIDISLIPAAITSTSSISSMSLCSSSAVSPASLNSNRRQLIPYKCPLCSLIYRTQAFLNEHMRKEHSVLI